ncbi:DUF4301 family protein [Flavobacteriaceae bacterium AU392]|nr:DUF4301 family protein [Flavobacteriaceae bacterium]RKM85055.1 DUF4301 family protein [Flavobacteriaceae bacterium AU392]
MKFTKEDIQQIESKGLTVKKVESQIELFRTGVPYINLKEAATIDNGIISLKETEKEYYRALFDGKCSEKKVVKFVPASGAATRMFKFLFEFLESYDSKKESINSYINKHRANELSVFFVGLEKLPFFEEVVFKLHRVIDNFNDLSEDQRRLEFVRTILKEDRLNYSFSPKGLLPFHKYKNTVCTAFEEHLFEAALYASPNNKASLHFTISEKYKHKFDEEFRHIEEDVEERTNTEYDVSFSYQKEVTETIAVTSDNKFFRDSNGKLLFRPSGHGALIENLNDLDADIIFIKNIDNVVVSKYKNKVARYKKILGGILLDIQAKAFQFLNQLESDVSESELIEIAEFLSNQLNVSISSEFEKYSAKYQVEYLKEKLNRPIRVCGMVKNEGEPGGGPFWVKDEMGTASLQIVESAQVDKKNKLQKNIFKNATHFNPVDLVCGIKDCKGKTFDLTKFVDSKTAFITMKTKTGKNIKALELPGLWNGAMANWNTVFVEVPLLTFNPVKTVNDLLKPAHQIS